MKNLFEKECEYCKEKFEDIFHIEGITRQKIIIHIVKCEEKHTIEKIQSGLAVFS